MRISGGKARGIILQIAKAAETRPATDFLRQAVFSALGPIDPKTHFLDLFAGTGAYGLEALSRGASGGLFIEKDPFMVKNLKINLSAVTKSAQANEHSCKITCADVFKTDYAPTNSFSLIFLDPPYAMARENLTTLIEVALTFINKEETSRIIFETPGDVPDIAHPHLQLLKRVGKPGRHTPNAQICSLRT